MAVIDYALHEIVNGHRLISFTPSVQGWDIVGSWSASIGTQTDGTTNRAAFPLGSSITFQGMANGIITSSRQGSDGESIQLEGYNAGKWLDRIAPPASDMPEGDTVSLIRTLAGDCGIDVVAQGTNGLPSIDARALVTASRVSEIIVELCQLSGLLPYIGADGKLYLINPTVRTINYPNERILVDGGEELALDGYAKGVSVSLFRRRKTPEEESGGSGPAGPFVNGSTPGGTLTEETDDAGDMVVVTLKPINVPKSVTIHKDETIALTDLPGNSVRIVTDSTETYEYDWDTGTYWEYDRAEARRNYQNNREHRWFNWRQSGYTKTTVVQKYLTTTDGKNDIAVQESTTETMSRTFDFDNRIQSETMLKVTARIALDGDTPEPEAGAPKYSPPFDEKITTTYKRTGFDDALEIRRERRTWEMQEIGQYPVVRRWKEGENGEAGQWVAVVYVMGLSGPAEMAIRANAFIAWVERIEVETTTEYLDDDGNIKSRSTVSYDDGGSTYRKAMDWTLAETTGGDPEDATKRRIQHLYEAFNEAGSQITSEPNLSGTPSDIITQELDLPGMEEYWGREGRTNTDTNGWYDPSTGGYIQSKTCPHYSNGKCTIYTLEVIGVDPTDDKCLYRNGLNWRSCPRALGALEQARAESDQEQFEKPVLGAAGDTNSGATYFREVYIRELGLTEEEAVEIANKIAANLLTIKSARGFIRTITIPLDLSLHPDGTITSVAHDYAYNALRTTISYRIDGVVPEVLIPDSAASASTYIYERESGRRTKVEYGEVLAIDNDTRRVTVKIGRGVRECTSRLIQVAVGDFVWVSMPAGNGMDGEIIKRS